MAKKEIDDLPEYYEEKIEKEMFELDSLGGLEDSFKLIDGRLGEVDIIENKPIIFKTEKIELEGTGNFLNMYDKIYNIPLEFIVFPFFTKSTRRVVNFEYHFKDLGLSMFSDLHSRKVEGKVIKQPSNLEENILEFVIGKYQELLGDGIDNDFIDLEIEDFICNYMGNKMHSAYYAKIEEALRNLKYTTYNFLISNHKKAGNFSFESKRFNLIDYEKGKKGKMVVYRIYPHENVIKKIKQKRFIKIKVEARNEIENIDSVALRIYQYLSMIRWGESTGEIRLELIAAVVPLKSFQTVKKKLKTGEEKEYKVSKLKQVLERVKTAFDVLVNLGYMKFYEVVIRDEDGKWNIYYEFGEKEGLLSTYLPDKNKNKIVKPEIEYVEKTENEEVVLSDYLKEQISYTKRNRYFASEYNIKVEKYIAEIALEYGEVKAREVLTIVYKNLNAKIKRSLVGYINKILEETLKNSKILKEEEKPTLFEQNDAQEQNTVQQMSSESLKVVKMLYDKMTDEEKEKFISKAMDIYLDENNGEMNKYTIRAFEQEDVKFYYIKKAIEQMN